MSVFRKLQLMQILNFKKQRFEKNCEAFFYLCFIFEIFDFKQLYPVLPCEKTLLNITQDEKESLNFPT